MRTEIYDRMLRAEPMPESTMPLIEECLLLTSLIVTRCTVL